MRSDPSNRKLLGLNAAGAATCGGVVILFCALGLRPLLGRAAAAATARHRLEAAVVQRDASDAAVRDATEQLRAVRRDLALTQVLRPPSSVNELLARVSAVAAGCGVRLDDVRVGKLANGDRYATLPVHAAGRGAYRDCVRFLHQVRHDCPDVGVAGFGLAAGADGGLNLDLDLRWHTAVASGP